MKWILDRFVSRRDGGPDPTENEAAISPPRTWRTSTMSNKTKVILELNQQQLELLDNTVSQGEGSDRESIVRRALWEYASEHRVNQEPGS